MMENITLALRWTGLRITEGVTTKITARMCVRDSARLRGAGGMLGVGLSSKSSSSLSESQNAEGVGDQGLLGVEDTGGEIGS